jgi:predicted nucleic acid-binding protein
MNSLDTNILYYATNADCPEHTWARPVVEALLASPSDWIIADQVLLEYYRLVRNPKVLAKPLNAMEAARRIQFFREDAGCLHCGYDTETWDSIWDSLHQDSFIPSRTFDLVLAATLQANDVKVFYTRNTADFIPFGFFEVRNPEKTPIQP